MTAEPFPTQHDDQLSAAGLARREQMRITLLDHMRVLHQRRRRRRHIAIAATPLFVLALIATIVIANRSNPIPRSSAERTLARGPEPLTTDSGEAAAAETEPARSMVLTRVESDPSTLARYRVTPTQLRARLIDDATLLDALTDLGRPAGLIRSQGRAWLTVDVANHGG